MCVIETTVGGSSFVPLCPTCHHILFTPFKSRSTIRLLLPAPSLSTTVAPSPSPTDHVDPDILPLSSRLIKPRKSHTGHQISPNSLRPHVTAPDRLFAWETPHAACHRQHLIDSLPSELVNSAMMSIRAAYTPNTKTTYAAGTLRFTQFCDRWGIDEEA